MRIKHYILIASGFLLFGCGSKENINYYLPVASASKSGHPVNITIDSVSYMSGDRIWYKLDDVFLPYKNSYFAKTQKEFIAEELAASLSIDGATGLNVYITDSYQIYSGDSSEYVLNTKIALVRSDATVYKNINVKKQGFGRGPKEAAKGFESAVKELGRVINEEFKAKKNK